MKKILICAFAAVALCACGKSHEGEAAGENHEAPEHGHQHEGSEIIVEPEVAARFGLKTDTVTAGEFATTLRASGTVAASGEADGVVSAPTAGIVRFVAGMNPGKNVSHGTTVATIDARGMSGGDSNAAARAALEAAETEYERIEALYKQQLATVGERNAALAAYRAAKAAYSPSASTGAAVSPIAGTLTSLTVREGQYVNAGDIIATVAAQGNLTLRIDIPQRSYADAATFTDAVVDFSYLPNPVTVSSLGGKRLGATPMPAGGSSAYIPVYFSVPRGSGIIPGSAFTAYLLGAPRQGVVTVPVSALSEQQGRYFVYERLDEEGFVKVPVTTGASDGRRIEILSGVHPGMNIVTEGVTTVRLAENSGNIPEGHTHNH
ncbi:MAG: efflux RND transporter periplasmic adaptor subunit [Muribaculaceae bacterium]|nr:efflux RND transporter periplasmic adaptor subunit [Muribaculaceae bacterium]